MSLLSSRYLARFVDSLVISLPLLAAFKLVTGSATAPTLGKFAVTCVVWFSYGICLEASPWQATVGKRLLHLRVYTCSGRRPGLREATGRNLAKDAPFLILAFLPKGLLLCSAWLIIQVLVVHFSRTYRGLHDRYSETVVAGDTPPSDAGAAK
ncbi:MAG TPA: RDD family protein [Candidatus Limnocylindrales bacterium]|nr:RDD family protein [Candidatus Limnocylindrales bacterium]